MFFFVWNFANFWIHCLCMLNIKGKNKKIVGQITTIWQNIITIFFRAQRCVHHHLGQSNQNMSCHPCHSTFTRSQAHSLHLFLCHKKEGENIYGVEIPNIVNTSLIRFVEIFKNRRNVTTSMVSKPKSFQSSKSCYFSSVDLKGSYLFWFPFKEPIDY